MNRSFFLRYWPYLTAFGLLSLWSMVQFPWHLSSSDAAFYLMNARELSQFQVAESINSYWSPLWSWLMVPFFWIGLEGLWPMKILQFGIGLYGVALGLRVLDHLKLRPALILVGGSLLLLSCWMMHLSHTPDLLMAILLLQYFFWIWTKPLHPIKIGLLGAALFWCKSFGFPFFIAHFLIWSVWYYWQDQDRKFALQSATTLFVFLCFSGCWMATMATKFGWVGLGTSGAYNMAYMGPIMNFQPPYFDHFIDPETDFTHYFIAEEQGLFGDYGQWSPFADAKGRAYYWGHLQNNFSKLYYISFLRDGFFLLLFFLAGWWIRRIQVKSEWQAFLWQVFLFLGVYVGGYFLLFPNERYLWIANLLVIPAILVFFAGFRQIRLIGGFQLICLGILMGVNLLAFAEIRLKDHAFYGQYHLHESAIVQLDLAGKNVVSNRRPYERKLKDHMDIMSYLAYSQKLKVWGLFNTKTLEKEGLIRLLDLPIDYFFLWETAPHAERHFQRHSLVASFPEIDLKIYRLNR
ncbi:MAG: hypothetical protein AAF598_00340 [Bacteroidota bacterium]